MEMTIFLNNGTLKFEQVTDLDFYDNFLDLTM